MDLGKIKIQGEILDRTRRAWVAPARDGRYVLGQLRSRTAGVSFLSFWDGVCRHNWNGSNFEKKIDFFRVPANRSLAANPQFFSAP